MSVPLSKLSKGDTIGVAAPSARFDRTRLDMGIATLESLGFKVHVPGEIFRAQRYLAGDDTYRARVLHDLFIDPDIQGIISARGGFGAMRVLPLLNWELIKAHPKCVVGFSDATALLTALVHRSGRAVVHGPNLVSLADPAPQTLAAFHRAVTGETIRIQPENGACLRPGIARGVLKGGNMATLAHLVGTRFQPDFTNTVLFLEDVGEPAYKIDRMLSQMKMAGMFHNVSGVVTGSFENCANPEYIPEILLDIFEAPDLPILTGLDCGHGPVNLSVVIGAEAYLDSEKGELTQ